MTREENVIAHWDFSESVGDELKDISTYGSHGKIFGAKWNKDQLGIRSLEFDGIDDYVEIDTSNMSLNPFKNISTGTLLVWFRVDSIPLEHGIMPIFYYGSKDKCDFFDAANNGLIIEVGHSPIGLGSKKLYYTVWANGCTLPSFCFDSTDPIKEKQWYHFVVVVGDNYNTGFLNGVEMVHRGYNFGTKTDSQFFARSISHEKLWIGKGFWDRKEMYLKGAVGEIRVYNKPLTQEEIMSLYNSTKLV
ncbi:MAG: hypothetical protein HeimC2_07510 [Candidatus Heimdallarchaeota archaeon LC_2]|nr:MAG: hypothetical protein HeimC2_07510 [Candidatus Heimdallarchaeota archaeon LC_2]